MAGRRNRSRRRRRLRAKLDSEASDSSPPQPSSTSSDDRAQRKIPSSNRQQQVTEEKADLRRPRDDRASTPQSSGSSSDDRTPERKIPSSIQQQDVTEEKPRPRDARAVRSYLLGLIRGYYIDVISRLPTAELRTTLARGLLVGGHCYGPLHPIHNIIMNSVWYAAAFPFRADSIDVDVITTNALARLVHRSLDGLVAYLCHHCPALSHDDALWHLSLSHGTLRGAAASARGAVSFGRMELEAAPFQMAAQAARHPKPAALAHFATSVLPAVERDALSVLAGKRRLSSQDIARLSAMLQPLPLPDEVQPQPPYPRKLRVRIDRIIAERRSSLTIWYQTLLDVADAALRKFARQTGARYSLHTIYGQNIARTGEFGLGQCFHINFMAWPEGEQNQSQTPVHFFAEALDPPTRNCSEEEITLCCMLVHAQRSSHVDNCYVCAKGKSKIDHPNGEEHFGGHPHKMVQTDDGYDYPSTVDVDFRFFDPDRDIDLVRSYADMIPCAEPSYSKPRSDRPKCHFTEDDSNDEDEDEDDEDDECFWEDFIMFCTRPI